MFGRSRHRAESARGEGWFNWPEWHQLCTAVGAAAAVDVEKFKAEMLTLDRTFPMSGRAGAYVWFALRYAVLKRLQRMPTPDDLDALAIEMHADCNRLVNVTLPVLQELLNVVFEFRRPTPATRGSFLVFYGAAALSILLKDSIELDEIEILLVPWYNENGQEFQALDPLGT